jgi:hypothetical protein
MTTTKMLTPVAFVALFALAAVPAFAGQHRGGGGHSAARSSRSAVSRSSGAIRGGVGLSGGIAVRGGGFVGGSSFYRPYYSFRPHVNLGYGLWMGYPYGYGYGYGYGYPYPGDPYAYGGYPPPSSAYAPYNDPSSAYPAYGSAYPANGSSGQDYQSQQPPPSIGVQRGGQQRDGQQTATGGVSFAIAPDTAAVFVDGTYVGTAGGFGPTSQPLGLIAGSHHIEIRASGYRSMSFDADVRPGQVIPFQGTLQKN